MKKTASTWLALAVLAVPAAALAGGKVHHVVIKDYNYHPADLVVEVGDTVVFSNEMTYGHWVISGQDMKHDNHFFSPLLLYGHTFEVQFKKPHVQDYYCPIHAMQARVTVIPEREPEGGGK